MLVVEGVCGMKSILHYTKIDSPLNLGLVSFYNAVHPVKYFSERTLTDERLIENIIWGMTPTLGLTMGPSLSQFFTL